MKKKVTFKEYILFAEAWFFLAISRLMLVFLPFRKIIPLLGRTVVISNNPPASTEPPVILSKISLSIRRAGKRSPWRTMCFEQALAAKMMLKRRKLVSTIYFGVCKNASIVGMNMSAHAWIESYGFILTGERNRAAFTIVSCFVS
ncbi:MAG: lasso peptide biosynthesis B2 protein [Bacteroidetes bacterium]|nr:lasso peptide biosynthesis B2 protein [Bacteroidota bacterium]